MGILIIETTRVGGSVTVTTKGDMEHQEAIIAASFLLRQIAIHEADRHTGSQTIKNKAMADVLLDILKMVKIPGVNIAGSSFADNSLMGRIIKPEGGIKG